MCFYTVFLQPPAVDTLTQTMLNTYSVEYTTMNVTAIEFTNYPNTHYVIENLLNATEYLVRVAVNNSAGLGDYSSPPVMATTSIVGQYVRLHYLIIDKVLTNSASTRWGPDDIICN